MTVELPATGSERTELHEERLDKVLTVLLQSDARTVLDLGCGAGRLLKRLVRERQFTRIVGMDTSIEALGQAKHSLHDQAAEAEGRLSLIHREFDAPDGEFAGFDAAAMVETIEHIRPERLSVVERVVFDGWRPAVVVITTPNGDYNPLLGLASGERRHADHHFEWGRTKFISWSSGVAKRNGYDVSCEGVGLADPLHGSPTQMAVFRLRTGGSSAGSEG